MTKKGPVWEREFAKILSLWWTNNKNDDSFYKTDGSGARHTTRAKKGKRTVGQGADISANNEDGMILTNLVIIEAKRGYTSKTVQEIFDRPKHRKMCVYEEWFEKAEKCCEDSGTFAWMFCVRRDWRTAVLFMPFFFFEELTNEMAKDNLFFRQGTHGAYGGFDYFNIKGDRKRVATVSWPLWEEIVKPDHIKRLAKRC